ncbi:hypothetical protein ARMSODRAFT_977701 [Armillaria solidipes]|uniref:Uncharacterized protein n=1 Tax=Armillaria solidipes TaxID=1076256 RepID=A0A2H3B572_9AGAR|nr:hypothetical protein ARMSODRAFT_977701 [Armillaria solidipes]
MTTLPQRGREVQKVVFLTSEVQELNVFERGQAIMKREAEGQDSDCGKCQTKFGLQPWPQFSFPPFHPYTQKSYAVCRLINEEGFGWTMEGRRVAVYESGESSGDVDDYATTERFYRVTADEIIDDSHPIKHESTPGKTVAFDANGRPSLIFFGGSVGSWDIWLGGNYAGSGMANRVSGRIANVKGDVAPAAVPRTSCWHQATLRKSPQYTRPFASFFRVEGNDSGRRIMDLARALGTDGRMDGSSFWSLENSQQKERRCSASLLQSTGRFHRVPVDERTRRQWRWNNHFTLQTTLVPTGVSPGFALHIDPWIEFWRQSGFGR